MLILTKGTGDAVPMCFFDDNVAKKCKLSHGKQSWARCCRTDDHIWINTDTLANGLGLKGTVKHYWQEGQENDIEVPDNWFSTYKLNNVLPIADNTSLAAFGIFMQPNIADVDVLFNNIAIRRFLNEGAYYFAVLHLYKDKSTDGRSSRDKAIECLNKVGNRIPAPLIHNKFDPARFYRCVALAELVFRRQPHTGYNARNLNEQWDKDGIPEIGSRSHRFVNFLAHVAEVLGNLQKAKFTMFEMLCHVGNVMEFCNDEGFILTLWYFRYHVLHMKQDGTWKPGNKRTLIPNVSRVTGPGMIPFAATLAPNLFDMPGSDKRPAKRMRTDIDTDGTSLANSTTSTHRRHAVVVTDFLQESSSSWKFLEKVLDFFDLDASIIEFHILQFFQCEIRRLLCKPQLREQAYPEDLNYFIDRYRCCSKAVHPHLLEFLQSYYKKR